MLSHFEFLDNFGLFENFVKITVEIAIAFSIIFPFWSWRKLDCPGTIIQDYIYGRIPKSDKHRTAATLQVMDPQ